MLEVGGRLDPPLSEMTSLFQKCQKDLMLNFKMIRYQDIKDKRRYLKCHAK